MIEHIENENQLTALAENILTAYPNERLFGFYGEMGVGKTTLIKELCKKLQVIDHTSSPTFAIVNEYNTQSGELVYHFDFYRIDHINELYQIGVEEYLESGYYCFMEWPEKAVEVLKGREIRIEMEYDEKGGRICRY